MFSERRILSTAKLCLPRQTAWKFATRCYTLLAGCGLNRSPSFDPLANLEVFAMQPPTFNSAMKTIERSAPRCSSSRFLAQRRRKPSPCFTRSRARLATAKAHSAG